MASPSLGRVVLVQIRPSDQPAGATEQAVYFLDGISAPDDRSTWADADSGALAAYSTRYNLVMPAGGAGTWMTDWDDAIGYADGTTAPGRWETFLTSELPAYLNSRFGVGTSSNAIVGLSMSGGSAVTIALDHPELFSVAQSMSSFYQTNNPVGWFVIPAIQSFVTGIANGYTAMWGDPLGANSSWWAHDVGTRIATLNASGQRIIITAGLGIPRLEDVVIAIATGNPVAFVTGVALEVGTLASTLALNAEALLLGLPVDFKYTVGIHSWTQWSANAVSDAASVQAALAATTPTARASMVPTVASASEVASPSSVSPAGASGYSITVPATAAVQATSTETATAEPGDASTAATTAGPSESPGPVTESPTQGVDTSPAEETGPSSSATPSPVTESTPVSEPDRASVPSAPAA
ncbi:alpha/beta hydrolase-fold protein [Gordonia sp. NPDC003504]